MKCPSCKKARLKRLRTYIQDLRVRRENLCPKCGARPVTIELDEAALLGELRKRDEKISWLEDQLSAHEINLDAIRSRAKDVFSFLLPASTPDNKPPRRSKKAVSRKILHR
jgi:transcriptional regulator NrdR family protein